MNTLGIVNKIVFRVYISHVRLYEDDFFLILDDDEIIENFSFKINLRYFFKKSLYMLKDFEHFDVLYINRITRSSKYAEKLLFHDYQCKICRAKFVLFL